MAIRAHLTFWQSRSDDSDLLDDATRVNTAARHYESETLLAHLDCLPRAFQAHGLQQALFVGGAGQESYPPLKQPQSGSAAGPLTSGAGYYSAFDRTAPSGFDRTTTALCVKPA
jgi:hypothetical protein